METESDDVVIESTRVERALCEFVQVADEGVVEEKGEKLEINPQKEHKEDERKERKASGDEVCCECSKRVEMGEDGMNCFWCEKWLHRECIGMSKKAYKAVCSASALVTNDTLHWFCNKCEEEVEKFKSGIGMKTTLQVSNEVQLQNLKEEMINKERNVEKLKDDLKKSKEEVNKKVNELAEYDLKRKKYESEIKKLKEEVVQFRQQVEKLISDAAESKTTINNLNRHISDLQKINEELMMRKLNMEKTTEEIKEDNENSEKVIDLEKENKNEESQPDKPLCRYVAKNMWCKFEKKCKFRHYKIKKECQEFGETEYRDQRKEQEPKLCSFFSRNRYCKFEDKCRFRHYFKAEEDKKNANLCWNYKYDGECKYGARCRYRHYFNEDEKRYLRVQEGEEQRANQEVNRSEQKTQNENIVEQIHFLMKEMSAIKEKLWN